MYKPIAHSPELSQKEILKTYWPLAASWLLMGLQIPMVSAIIARLADPKIHLAAFGGIVYPISLIVEAPIIMLLAASTALCKDWPTYKKLWRFMMVAGGILSVIHILVAFTPLYYVIVNDVIGAPKEIQEPARWGLMIMTPWSWAIAYRRFQQGVMIRFGKSGAVGIGTLIRLVSVGCVLAVGYALKFPGIIVAASAQTISVIFEAIYAKLVVRPILNYQVKSAPLVPLIHWKDFVVFYVPLALTSFLTYFWQPIGSAAISRMSFPIESLAVWPVITGVLFFLRAFGMAYNEVVVSLLDRPRSYPGLKRFAMIMIVGTSVLHLIVAATPLSGMWFGQVSALSTDLVELAKIGFWLGLPMAGLTVLQSWYQGMLVFNRRTRGIPESVAVYFGTVFLILMIGVNLKGVTGATVVMLGSSLASFTQTIWLWMRSKRTLEELHQRDLLTDSLITAA
jgi:hypothetical protein